MGLGFTIALTLISTVREILGNGTFFGISLFGPDFPSMLIMIMAPGGFLTLGLLLGLINKLMKKKA